MLSRDSRERMRIYKNYVIFYNKVVCISVFWGDEMVAKKESIPPYVSVAVKWWGDQLRESVRFGAQELSSIPIDLREHWRSLQQYGNLQALTTYRVKLFESALTGIILVQLWEQKVPVVIGRDSGLDH